MEGDKTMLVWLGKQYLAQREKTESDITINDNQETKEEFLAKLRKAREKGE